MKCPACSAKKAKAAGATPAGTIYTCGACGALYGTCYLGQSYAFVLPYWDEPGACPPAKERYFDFECLGSKGITRRHGWYNPATLKITQTG